MSSSKLKRLFIVVVSIAFLSLVSTLVFADMFGLLKKQDVVLSREVHGLLLDNGQPLSNVKVFRVLTYGEEYLDQVVTDENGHFYFPDKIIRSSKPSQMFFNSSLNQHIYAKTDNDDELVLWYARIIQAEDSETLTELLNHLVCDITNDAKTYDIPAKEDPSKLFVIYTRCKL
ncbi:DUF6795 domain-containing protein [Psychromonas arctica]|uniref:DUF6795 domain-containing protein n=1 Tax=Psychromonas arctica TaxID=168275 RepID=A0ABU9HGL5_9GAMM